VAIARTMELVNATRHAVDDGHAAAPAVRAAVESIAVVLSLFVPYTAEEMWSRLGHAPGIARAGWPAVDPALAAVSTAICAVQVNGKLRDRLEVPTDISATELETLVLASSAAQGRTVLRTIVHPPKLVNLVVTDG
jgi:leucyl-tRNA synthetase